MNLAIIIEPLIKEYLQNKFLAFVSEVSIFVVNPKSID